MSRSTRTAVPDDRRHARARCDRPGPSRPRRAARAHTITGLLAVALAGVAACSSPPPEPPATPDPVTVTPSIAADRSAPPEPTIPVVWPLTGVEADAVAERPAVAVKVENSTSARPQTGLSAADVVWETIVEFDVSRFIAVYHSEIPEEVGPIRSVRPMDPPITAPLGGLLVYSGGQSRLLSDVAASGVQSLSHDDGDPGLYRVSYRSAPHNVYGNVQTFVDQAGSDRAAPPPEQFVFALQPEQATAVVSGDPATSLSFRLSSLSRPSWSWDAGSGTWLRSEGGTPANDAGGDRLSAVNVVSITAPHPATRFRAQGGAAVPTYDLDDGGEALVATGGQVVAGTWTKAGDDEPLQLFDAAGDPLLLAPGNTWVELVPAGRGSVSTD